jgi:hypothetical protein
MYSLTSLDLILEKLAAGDTVEDLLEDREQLNKLFEQEKFRQGGNQFSDTHF